MVIDKREVGAPLFKITPFYHQILKFKVQSGESVYLAEFWPVPNVCQNHTRSKRVKKRILGARKALGSGSPSAAAETETGRSGWSLPAGWLTQERAVNEPAAGLALEQALGTTQTPYL